MKSMSKLLLLLAVIAATCIASYPAAAQRGGSSQQRITCSSNNGNRNWCDIGGSRDVRLVRQVSGSACIRDNTWGVDRRGLWVDRGCRAEFIFTGGRQSGPSTRFVTCSSNNGKRNWCQTSGDLSRITLSRQISGSACIQNQTWGVDRRGLWVDRGCRAEFTYGGGGNWQGPGQGPGQIHTITCSSNDGRRNYCSINGADLNNVVLTRQISGSACNRGHTWGIDPRGLWVDRGCRAEFQIRNYR